MEEINWLLTDRLKERYKKVRIQVLQQTPILRRSFLVVNKGEKIAYLEAFTNSAFKIPLNQPMGRFLVNAGFLVKREMIVKLEIALPQWLKGEFNSPKSNCVLGVYEFKILQKKKFLVFAYLLEVYSPNCNIDLCKSDRFHTAKKLKIAQLPIRVKKRLNNFNFAI